MAIRFKKILAETAISSKETQETSRRIIESYNDTIMRYLSRGQRIEIRGLGVFSIRTRVERMARNPRTGEPAKVEALLVPVFKFTRKAKRTVELMRLESA